MLARGGEQPGGVHRVPGTAAGGEPHRGQPAADPKPRFVHRVCSAGDCTAGDCSSRCLLSLAYPQGEPLAGLEHARLAEVDRVQDAKDLADFLAARWHRVRRGSALAELVHGPRPAGQRRDGGGREYLPDLGQFRLHVGHAEQVRRGVFRRPAGGEVGPDRGEVGVELGDGRRRASVGEAGRWHPDDLGDRGHLGDVAILVRVAERDAEEVRRGQARVHERRVHPDQQRRVARLVVLSRHRVGAAHVFVDLPHPLGRRTRRRLVAVGRGQHVRGGGGEPGRRVLAPVAVLVDPGHGKRVQRLEQQRPQAGDGPGQVGVQPPGHAARTEQAVVGGIDGNAVSERGRGALEQAGAREHTRGHGDDQPAGDGSRRIVAMPMRPRYLLGSSTS